MNVFVAQLILAGMLNYLVISKGETQRHQVHQAFGSRIPRLADILKHEYTQHRPSQYKDHKLVTDSDKIQRQRQPVYNLKQQLRPQPAMFPPAPTVLLQQDAKLQQQQPWLVNVLENTNNDSATTALRTAAHSSELTEESESEPHLQKNRPVTIEDFFNRLPQGREALTSNSQRHLNEKERKPKTERYFSNKEVNFKPEDYKRILRLTGDYKHDNNTNSSSHFKSTSSAGERNVPTSRYIVSNMQAPDLKEEFSSYQPDVSPNLGFHFLREQLERMSNNISILCLNDSTNINITDTNFTELSKERAKNISDTLEEIIADIKVSNSTHLHDNSNKIDKGYLYKPLSDSFLKLESERNVVNQTKNLRKPVFRIPHTELSQYGRDIGNLPSTSNIRFGAKLKNVEGDPAFISNASVTDVTRRCGDRLWVVARACRHPRLLQNAPLDAMSRRNVTEGLKLSLHNSSRSADTPKSNISLTDQSSSFVINSKTQDFHLKTRPTFSISFESVRKLYSFLNKKNMTIDDIYKLDKYVDTLGDRIASNQKNSYSDAVHNVESSEDAANKKTTESPIEASVTGRKKITRHFVHGAFLKETTELPILPLKSVTSEISTANILPDSFDSDTLLNKEAMIITHLIPPISSHTLEQTVAELPLLDTSKHLLSNDSANIIVSTTPKLLPDLNFLNITPERISAELTIPSSVYLSTSSLKNYDDLNSFLQLNSVHENNDSSTFSSTPVSHTILKPRNLFESVFQQTQPPDSLQFHPAQRFHAHLPPITSILEQSGQNHFSLGKIYGPDTVPAWKSPVLSNADEFTLFPHNPTSSMQSSITQHKGSSNIGDLGYLSLLTTIGGLGLTAQSGMALTPSPNFFTEQHKSSSGIHFSSETPAVSNSGIMQLLLRNLGNVPSLQSSVGFLPQSTQNQSPFNYGSFGLTVPSESSVHGEAARQEVKPTSIVNQSDGKVETASL